MLIQPYLGRIKCPTLHPSSIITVRPHQRKQMALGRFPAALRMSGAPWTPVALKGGGNSPPSLHHTLTSPFTGLVAHRKSLGPNLACLPLPPRPSCSFSALWGGGESLHPPHNHIASSKLTDLPKAPQPLLFGLVRLASPRPFGLPVPGREAGRCLLETVAAVLQGKDRISPLGSFVPM